MVHAAEDFKRKAVEFSKTVRAYGQTDVLSALRRAFGVLAAAPGPKTGKLIYLLTDGEFSDKERVMWQIAEENVGKCKFVDRNE